MISDDEEELVLKFDDCLTCKYRFEPELYCFTDCDCGESYDPEDEDEVDTFFKGRY